MKLVHIQSNTPEIIKAIGIFRVEVWRSEESLKTEEYGDGTSWNDAYDFLPTTHHWVVLHENKIVASARLSLHDCLDDVPYAHVFGAFGIALTGRTASFNRLAVDKQFRGRGLARTLDLARLEMAQTLCADHILVLPVSPARRRALMALGFDLMVDDFDPLALGVSCMNAKMNVFYANLRQKATVCQPGEKLVQMSVRGTV